MPPRKSTASEAATVTDAGDLSALSLPPDLEDNDLSMLSATSTTANTSGKPSSRQKEKGDSEPVEEKGKDKDKDKDKEKDKDTVGIDVCSSFLPNPLNYL